MLAIEIKEALKASKEHENVIRVLGHLRKELQGTDGASLLTSLLKVSPKLDEVVNLWSMCMTRASRRGRDTQALMHVLAAVLNLQCGEREEEVGVVRQGHQLALRAIFGVKAKHIQQLLVLDDKLCLAAAFELLVAVARKGPEACRSLLTVMDLSSATFLQLSKPPRFQPKPDLEHSSGTIRGKSYWATWAAKDISKRPTRALFVDFAITMLESSSSVTLASIANQPQFISAVLGHLATDPPAIVLRLLQIVANRVLAESPQMKRDIRATFFSDSVLAQLASLISLGPEVLDPDNQDSIAATAADEILSALITDPMHGLVPDSLSHLLPGAQFPLGAKRILRLLPKLDPIACLAHARLIHSLAEFQPAIAAEFASSLPYTLEPSHSSRWIATASVVNGLLSRISVVSMPLASPQLHSYLTATSNPSITAKAIQLHMRKCFPPAISKACLSRGIQHPQPALELLSLELLEGCLRSILPLVRMTRQRSLSDDLWSVFSNDLQTIIRSRVPDPQILIALHSAIVKGEGLVLSEPLKDSTEEALELSEIERALFQEGHDLSVSAGRVQSCLSLSLMRVFALYQEILCSSMVDAHFDILKMIPQDIITCFRSSQPAFHLAILDLFDAEAALDPSPDDALMEGGIILPAPMASNAATHLLPLLQLSGQAADETVRERALRLAMRKLQAVIGGQSSGEGYLKQGVEGSEALIWLWLLPREACPSPCCEAMAAFLSSSALQVARRPNELYELSQSLAASGENGQGGALSQSVSLLAISCTRSCLKMTLKGTSEFTRHICGYVARSLRLLIDYCQSQEQLVVTLKALVESECVGNFPQELDALLDVLQVSTGDLAGKVMKSGKKRSLDPLLPRNKKTKRDDDDRLLLPSQDSFHSGLVLLEQLRVILESSPPPTQVPLSIEAALSSVTGDEGGVLTSVLTRWARESSQGQSALCWRCIEIMVSEPRNLLAVQALAFHAAVKLRTHETSYRHEALLLSRVASKASRDNAQPALMMCQNVSRLALDHLFAIAQKAQGTKPQGNSEILLWSNVITSLTHWLPLLTEPAIFHAADRNKSLWLIHCLLDTSLSCSKAVDSGNDGEVSMLSSQALQMAVSLLRLGEGPGDMTDIWSKCNELLSLVLPKCPGSEAEENQKALISARDSFLSLRGHELGRHYTLLIESTIALPSLTSAGILASALPPNLLPLTLSRLQSLSQANTEVAIREKKRYMALFLPIVGKLMADKTNKKSLVALASIYREPLLAYLQRKRRKAVESTGQDTEEDQIKALQGYAINVLLSCLVLKPLDQEAETKLIHKLLPSDGFPLDDVSNQPVAGVAEQLQLCENILSSKQGPDGIKLLVNVEPLLVCCCRTLSSLIQGEAFSTDSSLAIQDRVIQSLDGLVGDSLAGLPDDLRNTPPFIRVGHEVMEMTMGMLSSSVNPSPRLLRCARRLIAALLPIGSETEGEEEVEEEGLEQQDEAESALTQPALPHVPVIPSQALSTAVSTLLEALFSYPLLSNLEGKMNHPPSSLTSPTSMLTHLATTREESVITLTPGSVDCGSLVLESLLLLETVVDAQRAFAPSLSTRPWPESAADVSSLHSLLRMLQCSYSATMSVEDGTCLRLMTKFDALIQQSLQGTNQPPLGLLASRLSGPLALSGYLWGSSAKSYYQRLDGLAHTTALEDALDVRGEVLGEMSLDVARSCITCLNFPLSRGLSAEDDIQQSTRISDNSGYDPAFITLFVLSCLGGSQLPSRRSLPSFILAQWGLLSICLRGSRRKMRSYELSATSASSWLRRV